MTQEEKETKIQALQKEKSKKLAEQHRLRSNAMSAPTFTQRNLMYSQADQIEKEIGNLEKLIRKVQNTPTDEEVVNNPPQEGTIEYLLYLLSGGGQ